MRLSLVSFRIATSVISGSVFSAAQCMSETSMQRCRLVLGVCAIVKLSQTIEEGDVS